MVKKKGGREFNPADAYRKSQKAKEISKNKRERHLRREALAQRDDAEGLRKQLKEVLDAEHAGQSGANLRMRKRALQEAYDQAVRKQMESKSMAFTSGVQVGLLPPIPSLPESTQSDEFRAFELGGSHVLISHGVATPRSKAGHEQNASAQASRDAFDSTSFWTGASHNNTVTQHATNQVLMERDSVENEQKKSVSASAVITGSSTVLPAFIPQQDKQVTGFVPAVIARRIHGKQPLGTKHPMNQSANRTQFGLLPSQDIGRNLPTNKKQSGEDHQDEKTYDEFMKSMRELGAI